MQIIQQIRDKGAAIVIGVIALSLIGFILMDANLGSSRMSASGANTIGDINGTPITTAEFQSKVKQMEEQYGGRISGAQLNYLRNNVWEQLVAEKVLTAEFEKLGLTFTPNELSSVMFSQDAPQSLKQAFTDQNGQYDIQKAQQWWTTIKKSKGEQRDAVEAQVVEPIKLQSLYTKYSSLIAASGYYPAWMKEKEKAEATSFSTISYVAVPYNVISDSTVKVTDEDITSYLSKHKAMYEQDGGRYISYVSFDANPTAADTAKVYSEVAQLKASLETVTDSTAKVFVSRNMSTKKFEDAYTVKSKLTMSQKDSIAALPAGAVYGPYLDGREIVIAKMLGSRQLADSVKVRHILVATSNPQTGEPTLADSIAKKRIDSIELAIQGGADFNMMVLQYSDDQGSKEKKGEYDFSSTQFTSLARKFSEAAFYGNVGDKKVIKTEFGYHYIEVLSQKNFEPAYKVAYISREILPSDETINTANAKASKLSGEARDAKALEAYVAKNGLQKIDVPVLIKENDFQLGALQDARQIVRWAFEAKQGEVSEPFSVGDQFVVAMVAKVQAKGLPDAKAARPQTESLIKNQKKAELIKTKLTATPTLETAAAAYNLQPAVAGADSSLTFSTSIVPGVGQEPKLIGAAFNKAYQAKVSEPIAGLNGVYVVKINSIGTKPSVEIDAVKADSDRTKALAGQISSGWFESLKKLADIKDERSKIN